MSIASIKNALSGLKSLVIGLGITGRAFCEENVTVIYPKEQVDNLSTYRGHVELVGKEGAPGEPKCTACGLCATSCPSNCFTILCPVPAKDGEANCNQAELGPAPQRALRLQPSLFWIFRFAACAVNASRPVRPVVSNFRMIPT